MGPYLVPGKAPHYLSAAVESDIPEIVRVLNLNQDIYYNTATIPFPYLEAHGQEKIAQANAFRSLEGCNSLFAIRTSPEGPLIGWIQFIPVAVSTEDAHYRHPVTGQPVKICLVGYWISPEYQGQGYASRSTRFLIEEILFGALDFDIVRAGSYCDNGPSRAVLVSAGMRCELERKEEWSKKLQIWRDVCTYARHRAIDHTGHILFLDH